MTQVKQVEQLKLNVTNIHSFLVKKNKEQNKLRLEKKRIESKNLSIQKLKKKEKKLETKSSPVGKASKNVQDAVTSEGSLLDKLLNFGGLILAGILVNNLPKIIDKVKEVIDSIVNFITPIQSGFNLIKSFFTGELDQNQLDVDKKRFDDGLDSINDSIDKLAEKAGPLGGLIKLLKPVINRFKQTKGQVILQKRGDKEGFLNTETGKFTERQFTSAERKRYESGDVSTTGTDYSEEDKDGSVSAAGETTGNIISGYPITSDYGYRTHPVTGEAGKLHGGIDIGTPTGTAVSLAEDGMIVAAGEYGGYGYMIDAWLPNSGVQIRLAHLSEIIKSSGTFKANEILGKTGGAAGSRGAGSSTGPHLHFEADTQKGSGRYGGSGNPNIYSKLLRLGSFQSNKTSDGKGGVISPIASTPKEKIASINQPDPRKRRGSMSIAIQQVNTIQPMPYMVPMPIASKSTSSPSQPQLSPLWSV